MQLTTADYKLYFKKGIDYHAYLSRFEKEMQQGESIPNFQYLPTNWQRMSRIYKTYNVGLGLAEKLSSLQQPLHWLLISEHWCGDASQSVPVVAKIALASLGKIQLRIVYRDENPQLIDAHLTNGGKAIPILLQLNSHFELLGTWGPRPDSAQKLVLQSKKQGLTVANYATNLHKWYANDAQQSIEKELEMLIAKTQQHPLLS